LTRDHPVPRTDEAYPEDPERTAQMMEILNASPVYRLLHMRVVHAAGGRSRIELAVGEDHKNLYGTVHGGLLATLMDSACGAALGTRLQPGENMVTLDLRVNYLLPVRSGPLTAEGEIVHRGRNTGVAEASLRDESGRLVARGMSTHFIRKVDEP
jgi:uncharacterized protein (TIGR00369 family)